jgi:Skp family chaperone for outer membrane proteins
VRESNIKHFHGRTYLDKKGENEMKHFGIVLAMIGVLFFVFSCGESTETGVTSEDVKKETKEAYDTAVEYSKQQKEEILRKMQAKLDQYKQNIEKLKIKTELMSEGLKADFDRRVDELQEKQEAAEEKLSELKSSSGKAWSEIKEGLDQAMLDLDQAYVDARSQFK